jgi:chromosome segregation ATPase
MASKKQQVVADLNKLESKASSLKATLVIYREQLDTALMQVKSEFKMSEPTPAKVNDKIKQLANELTHLQSQRDAANQKALKLMEKMG